MSQLLLRPIEFSQYKTGMERPLAKSSNKTTGSSFRRPRFRETKNRTSTTVDNKGTRLLTEKTKSLQTAYNNLQLHKKLNIIESVVKDVSNYLTLDIY